MDKIIRRIGPSVQRTISGDRLDYLARDKTIMIVGIPNYYDNCGLSNIISLINMYILYFVRHCFRNSFPYMHEVE